MAKTEANGIQMEYETFGSLSDKPLLLIIGLGGQLLQWDKGLCRDLASRGHYVIRYDNRDVGLSTKFDQTGIPNIVEAIGEILTGDKSVATYSMGDMADDAAGLLDALGIPAAHICGMSMGGMIAQTLALRHPSRVLSLTSIYSNTGNPQLPQPKPEIMEALITPPPAERAANIEHMTNLFRMIAGPGFPFEEEWVRRTAAASYDRSFYTPGLARQLLAILTQDDRRAALANVKAPTLVIHGTSDPLVPVEGGKETAAAIPGAELMLVEGMGHDLPYGGAWPKIIEALAAHTLKAAKRN
jgi:pimeloyl-ACP methyl ester carboxylesterase